MCEPWYMGLTEEKMHIVACPAARRALRQNNPRVMWCLNYIARLFDNDVKFSDERKPGFSSPGCIIKEQHLLDFMKSFDPYYTVTIGRSKIHHNEIFMLISQRGHGLLDRDGVEFEMLLNRCKPVFLV